MQAYSIKPRNREFKIAPRHIRVPNRMLYLLCVERMTTVAEMQLNHECALHSQANNECIIKNVLIYSILSFILKEKHFCINGVDSDLRRNNEEISASLNAKQPNFLIGLFGLVL